MSFGRKRTSGGADEASLDVALFAPVAPAAPASGAPPPPAVDPAAPPKAPPAPPPPVLADIEDAAQADKAYARIRGVIFERLNVSAAVLGGREVMARELRPTVAAIVAENRMRLTRFDQDLLIERMLDDMFGLGPIEPLLADPTITDILINGPKQVYVERFGKLHLTEIGFESDSQLVNIAQRIAAAVGRRVDETSPLVDARLADGSRVNIVVPPLALNGACVSIRKFAKRRIGLRQMAEQGNMSAGMARLLELAGRIRLNILISGGTGSGKTTLMNAISAAIAHDERVVTIEDAAELQLQQPHVVRLETRPMSIEGTGQIDQRQLVVNALRMRPDRIILGETRGAEAFDVLQAMNTGHDGSMTTIHANTARDALIRLENMVIAGNPNLPLRFVRGQIVGAVHLIAQVSRMRDGVRRVTQIVEVAGVEGETVTTQELYRFVVDGGGPGEPVRGRFVSSGLRPLFSERAREYGLEAELDGVTV
jgi:pilus assembly protein CpaF